ncbi:MAG: CHAD domain-containing protein [Bacteroidales bacterium]|nr:CHAD domain-containing protein [Bacteroidales bacterium]
MNYSMDFGAYLTEQIKNQVANSINLTVDSELKPEQVVHEIRKSMKRCKAYLSLLKPALPPNVYLHSKYAIRSVSKLLAEYRTSTVNLNCFQSLKKDIKNQVDDKFIEKIEQILLRKKQCYFALFESVSVNGFVMVQSQLNLIPLNRLEEKCDSVSHEQIYNEMDKTVNMFIKRMLKKSDKGDSEQFHEWRKAVKRMMYQTNVLNNVLTDYPYYDYQQLDELADFLGEDHDISELLLELDNTKLPASYSKSYAKFSKICRHKLDKYKRQSINYAQTCISNKVEPV